MTQAAMPQGPFCQSCSMPLTSPEQFGTTAQGFRQNDYCAYCYSDGAFINPETTLREMIDFVVPIMAEQMGEEQARSLTESTLPLLKRWRTD